MAVSADRQLRFWGIAAVVFILVLWLLGSTLLPFLLGAAIAYFLDPLADRLERLGLSRLWATAVIAVTAVVVFVLVLVLAVPALIQQVQGLIATAPDYVAGLMTFLSRRYPDIFGENSPVMRNLAGVETMLREGGLTVLNQVLGGSLHIFDFLILLVVTPVVAFYLLLDWDRMVATSTRCCRASTPDDPPARARDRRGAGGLRARAALGLPDPRHLLRGGADGDRAAVRLPRRAGRGADLVHPLRRLDVGLVLSIGIALFQFWDDKIWIFVTPGSSSSGSSSRATSWRRT